MICLCTKPYQPLIRHCGGMGQKCFKFYEKPMCPNRVLQKDSALSQDCIRSSLTQEVVRRMLNCSEGISVQVRQDILSKFSQKMLNSGHSVMSTQITLVHGMTKYLEMVKRSKLTIIDPKFQPLHFDKKYKRVERKFNKFLSKSGWYASDDQFK